MDKKVTTLAKYEVIKDKVKILYLGGSSCCPECGSLMRIFKDGLYEEAECLGCGLTQTNEKQN